MDKKMLARIAALRAKAGVDPKNIDGMTDAVGTEQKEIAGLVEKIMTKMDAKDGAGKYHLAANQRKALKTFASLVSTAFGVDPMAAGAPPAPSPAPAPAGGGAGAPGPMDAAFGETPAIESADAQNPAVAPLEAAEEAAKSFGDPAIDALFNIIELLIKKDAGDDDSTVDAIPALNGGADDAGPGADAPFGGDDAALGDDAGAPPPFGGDDAGSDDAAPAPKKDSAPKAEGDKPAPKEKSEDSSSDKDSNEGDDSEESDDKSDDKEDKPEEKIEAAAELFLLRKKISAAKAELDAIGRVKALSILPKEQRLAKAAAFRKLAEAMEKGEMPQFLEENSNQKKEEEPMDKSALKDAMKAVLAALEAGENDEKYVQEADPEKESEKGEELAKDASLDRKSKVLAHLAKLRITKANVDGKSMATPKEVPSPEGTVEDTDHGDAKIQYQDALGGVNLGEIQTKKQKLPTDKNMSGEAAEIYQGNNPEAQQTIQTEKDSSKDVNNKKTLSDMGTAVQPDHPVSPTEKESGAGSHQKEKTWEKAKSESDTTPTGPRLVGLAQRVLKLARLAESKGVIKTAAQFDELLEKYAEFDDVKLATLEEVYAELPSVTATKTVKADGVWEDNEAVTDAEEESPETPSEKVEAAMASGPRTVRRAASADAGEGHSAGIKRPISMTASSEISRSGRFDGLKNNMPWSGPTADPNQD
jgi:ribosomal protein S20